MQLQRSPHWCMQRLSVGSRANRTVCRPLCAKQKSKQANVKVDKRGKVASRPGPGSPLLEQAQQLMQQQPQVVPPAADVTAQQQQPTQQQQQQQPQQPSAAAASPQVPSITETPQVVVDRMFKRVITFAGLPVITGLILFPVFWYLRVVQKVEYPLWVVYVTQALMFGGGLAGITYGILSTSWDPRREGTALGWTELQANLPILLNKNKQGQ